MGISPSFFIAYSGLKAHQEALQVTSNNISNASNNDYVRERVEFVSNTPLATIPGDIGNGVHIEKIYRITNTFLFDQYTKTNQDASKYETMENYFKQITSYFPDIDDNGLFADIKNYFNAWQNLASNPNDGSAKIDLANKAQILADSIHTLTEKLNDVQKQINFQIEANIKEANQILREISEINKQINNDEAGDLRNANELRDTRDKLEKRLKELLGVKVYKNDVQSFFSSGEETIDYAKDYTISLGGYTILSNDTYHEIDLENINGNFNLFVQLTPMIKKDITDGVDGEVGGLIEIRGSEYDDNGYPTNGIIGDLFNSLNAFSQSLIRSTNSIYSYSAQKSVETDNITENVSISPDEAKKPLPLLFQKLKNPVKEGILSLVIYDNNGNYLDKVEINIDPKKSINQILDDINTTLSSNPNSSDYEAKLVNGEIKFVNKNTNEITPNVLVKDDGSLLFQALGEIEYLPLKNINFTDLPIPLENGNFDIVVYNNSGDEIARRTITVNMDSSDPRFSTIEGIISQINTPNKDDNSDNNLSNDIDDYYNALFINGKFVLNPKSDTTYVGFDNDEANIGGAFGINKFFDGKDAFSIDLAKKFKDDPSQIHAYKPPNDGDNQVANAMLQLQFQNVIFYKDGQKIEDTLTGFYRQTTATLANTSQEITNKKDSAKTLLKSIEDEYYSIAGVNLDEELINLEKYQRGYQANAKVITTINQMLDTLLGIKQ